MEKTSEFYDRSKTQNLALLKWLDKMVEMCAPREVHWCDRSDEECDQLCQPMIKQGSMIPLNSEKGPNSYLVR